MDISKYYYISTEGILCLNYEVPGYQDQEYEIIGCKSVNWFILNMKL